MKITKARLKEIIQEELGELDREEMTEDDRPFRDQMTRDEYEATRGLGDRIKDAGHIARAAAVMGQMYTAGPLLAVAYKFKEDIMPALTKAGKSSAIGAGTLAIPLLVKAGLLDPKHLKNLPADLDLGTRIEDEPEEEL